MNILVTGASGMVGEGVVLECLQDPAVVSVVSLSRRPSGHKHPKLRELLVEDFFHLEAVEAELAGFDACFFCAGISSIGLKEPEYTRITYDMTLHVARTLVSLNPGMTFCYVSGAGTDSTEQGRSMWARVKGHTENALQALPFRQVYLFRPGFMKPMPGQLHLLKYYKAIGWLYPFFRLVTPQFACTLRQVARAMVLVVQQGYPTPILEVRDIHALTQSA